MKKALLILSLISSSAFAQVSTVVRHPSSYTKEVFAYQGSRIMQVDEVSSPGNEENVFIFSKVDRGTQPDAMYFQRFTKLNGSWKLVSSTEIRHDGLIGLINNRKTFSDTDKNKSVDGLFIYSQSDYEGKQESIHLLFSHAGKIFTIAAHKADNYANSKFSDNFEQLSPAVKNTVMAYWSKLDKAD